MRKVTGLRRLKTPAGKGHTSTVPSDAAPFLAKDSYLIVLI